MAQDKISDKTVSEWGKIHPLIKEIMALKPVFWLNSSAKKMKDVPELPVSEEDIHDASDRWERFAPFLQKAFPETEDTGGIIESALAPIPGMKTAMEKHYRQPIAGQLYLKCDNLLPIAGSIKARGGIYELNFRRAKV